jgi:lambda repressor-like predicted transcriptional regulator
MGMAQVIRVALIKRGTSITELAEKLGCTSQNISSKLRRDNFSEKELQEIAAAIGCHFEGKFIVDESGETL